VGTGVSGGWGSSWGTSWLASWVGALVPTGAPPSLVLGSLLFTPALAGDAQVSQQLSAAPALVPQLDCSLTARQAMGADTLLVPELNAIANIDRWIT
jgi:hypothetical protein